MVFSPFPSLLSNSNFMTEHGHVYSWGLGVFGQLGHGNLDDLRQPKRVEYLVKNGIKAVQVVCGAYHTVARTCIFLPQSTLPTRSSLPAHTSHALSYSHILAKGELYSFGHGEYGQHGGVANYSDWGSGESVCDETHPCLALFSSPPLCSFSPSYFFFPLTP